MPARGKREFLPLFLTPSRRIFLSVPAVFALVLQDGSLVVPVHSIAGFSCIWTLHRKPGGHPN